MAKTTPASDDNSGESSWTSVLNSIMGVAKSGVDTYATSAGLKKNSGSSNPDDYRTQQTSARQPNGTPLNSATTPTTTYVMWGALAVFILVILILLVKVL